MKEIVASICTTIIVIVCTPLGWVGLALIGLIIVLLKA